MSHDVGTVDPDVPRDSDNELWPWPKPDECPADGDGCVTDVEGAANYTANEVCVSKALNGEVVRMVFWHGVWPRGAYTMARPSAVRREAASNWTVSPPWWRTTMVSSCKPNSR